MLNDYQLSAMRGIWPCFLVPLASAVIYWFLSAAINKTRRVLVAGHGLLLPIAFAYAIVVSPITGHVNWEIWIWPFWILLTLFWLSMLYTLVRFEGNRWVHLIQILVAPCGFFVWWTGTMTITHDWV